MMDIRLHLSNTFACYMKERERGRARYFDCIFIRKRRYGGAVGGKSKMSGNK